jgi:phosphatidylinositol 4-kinase B
VEFGAQSLWTAGYEAAAKHSEKVVQLVEMMQHSGCPCFAGGKRSLDALRKRFRLDAAACQGLIADSVDAWTTRQYDYYQRITNGIL